MKIIAPEFEILDDLNGEQILKKLERAGRICYKSEHKTTEDSAERFVAGLLKKGHESVIEHEKISVKLVCDRGVTHEIVRHRLASYSQESTRYCNYAGGRFGGELTFIRPFYWAKDSAAYSLWERTMAAIEEAYIALLEVGAAPEQARAILPNSLKTEIVITMNLREWRHFFRLRTSPAAHPQMREIALPLLKEFQKRLPVLFDDIIV